MKTEEDEGIVKAIRRLTAGAGPVAAPYPVPFPGIMETLC
jgi:hypothetical protein